MKKLILLFLISLMATPGFSQSATNYPHCKCTETLSAEGEYKLICAGIVMEQGNYSNQKKSGEWVSRNTAGTTIIKATYKEGVLEGAYEQFHFKGKPKLTAHFQNGFQEGKWTYFNDKGKVIKEGSFANGLPIGIWTCYDKSGKKILAQYDFDNKHEKISGSAERYFHKGGIARDDISGEWMIVHFPNRRITSEVTPFGGHLLAGDIFLDYLNIPFMFMNTYTHYEFVAELEVSMGIVTVVNIKEKASSERFDTKAPAFPFIVQTNSPNKLSSLQPSQESLQLLKDRLKEAISIAGPWVTNGYEGTIEVQIPFVLNDITKL